MADRLREEDHQAWTAYDAHLEEAPDDALLAYAEDKGAVFVTTNRDAAALARRLRAASTIWLSVREVDVLAAIDRALSWLAERRLPDGFVLKVPKHAPLALQAPLASADERSQPDERQ